MAWEASSLNFDHLQFNREIDYMYFKCKPLLKLSRNEEQIFAFFRNQFLTLVNKLYGNSVTPKVKLLDLTALREFKMKICLSASAWLMLGSGNTVN